MSANNESRRIEGYALVFEVPSTGLSQFTEVIKRGALDGVIENSDVVMTYDHNASRGILARSTNGVGSLKLEVDERGLKYSFDAPHTALGDELLEGIRRGDIRSSSFAFIVEKDEWEMRNGQKYRTITKIKQLFDVSAVVNPAYDAATVTVVDTRGAEALDEVKEEPKQDEPTPQPEEAENRESDEKPKENEEEPKPAEDEPKQEEEPKEEPEQKSAEEKPSEEEKPNEEEPKPAEEDKRSAEADDTLYIRNKENNSAYMPKLTLTTAIRSMLGGALTDEQRSIINEARSAMAKNGLTVGENELVLPFEQRAEGDAPAVPSTANGVFTATYSDEQGKVNVQTDVYNILEPLRNALILNEAGATILTGLRGNVRIPKLQAGQAFFENETAEAQKSGQTFDKVELRPHRISAYVPISRQLLYQSQDANVDAVLTRDLIAAISQKIESQFFGDDAAADDRWGGIFENTTAAALNYNGLIDAEEELESANVNNFIYLLSPKAKAALRKMTVDKGSGKFAMESGEVLGTKALVSGNIKKNGLALVNGQDIVMGIWGNGLSMIVDPFSNSLNDVINIVATMYCDVVVRRPESVVTRVIA